MAQGIPLTPGERAQYDQNIAAIDHDIDALIDMFCGVRQITDEPTAVFGTAGLINERMQLPDGHKEALDFNDLLRITAGMIRRLANTERE
jgi:hypothetical protein